PSRRVVTYGSLIHWGTNSGLNSMSKKTRAVWIKGIILLNSSSVLESIQCASASTMISGCLCARLRRYLDNVAMVSSFCFCGVALDDGSRAGVAVDNKAAYNEMSS